MSPDKSLLARLPDPRRCKSKHPARDLDRVVGKSPWFAFGFRAGDRRLSFSYAADGSGKRPNATLLVSHIVSVEPDGRTRHTSGPCGEAPPMTISGLLRQLDGPAPDLKTLWVSFHERAPKPGPFAELVGAALVHLLGATATPLETDGAVGLAQRALGSDNDLRAFVALKGGRFVTLSSAGDGMISLHRPGRRPTRALSLEQAVHRLAAESGSKLDPAHTRFEFSSHDNRRLGTGPWVDPATLRKLLVAALGAAAGGAL